MASLLQYILTWALALSFMVVHLAAADGLPKLRIMPLGDSITKGNGSPDMNGYRSKLCHRLVSNHKDSNFSVDMIGSLRDGEMRDNDHEGHSGKYLADIRQYLELSIDAQPNIVLVHAGTNNMDKEVDLDKEDQLIESIIDRLLEGSPGVTVLIAPVIWANDPRMQKNTDAYNKKLREIIEQRQDEGQHIIEVPISISVGDLSDKKHPNSVGYGKMAAAWYDGILEAQTHGWIKPPTAVNTDDHPGMGLGDGAKG
ncbi:SGNH hydrolase-type esterase domain-containing protein [Aspergillus parasiticus]|uniref:SGNH hydrolase-type esterase domain-containing protein n=1 Tax=Aspergillus parasiticus TaxID=5067 RepID=A0A5N6D4E2_ASPPA|nr:SGNH hydrolase-type esterase domain-containing protein [Aspergillus parasiticus]